MAFDLLECPHGGKVLLNRSSTVWKLVHFIRHLPSITREELAEMEKYNPVSQADREEQEQIDRFLQGEEIEPESHAHHH